MKFTSTGALAAAVALVLVATAEADVIVYTDETAFLAHTQPGFYRETFTSLPVGVNESPLTFSNNGFAYEATSLSHFIVRSHLPVKWVSPSFLEHNIVIDFTSGNVTAIGGHFFNIDRFGDPAPGLFLLSLSDGTSEIFNDPTPATFRGFTSSTPIDSMVLTPDPIRAATVTDFIVGVAVPGPSTVLLVGIGWLGLVATVRRRRLNRESGRGCESSTAGRVGERLT
jgi:hypothetical protein